MTETPAEIFEIYGVEVKATKSSGGKFYDVIFPDGERVRYLSSVFQEIFKKKEGSQTSGHCTR